jgi:hypothetical protein
VGDDERLLAALGLVLFGLFLGQSRVERDLHHGATWSALGGREGGGDDGLRRGLRMAAAASSAGLLRDAAAAGSRAGYCGSPRAA